MRPIQLPDPCLVVLVGPAGAGKSSFAARHFQPDEILSSDAYRAAISGNEADQRATRAAFGRLHRQLARQLAAGRSAVVDATNLEPGTRQALLTRAAATGVPAVAIVLDVPPAVVRARNASRDRVVDEAVVTRHLDRLRAVLDGGGLMAEGFAAVVVLRSTDEVETVRIIRRHAP